MEHGQTFSISGRFPDLGNLYIKRALECVGPSFREGASRVFRCHLCRLPHRQEPAVRRCILFSFTTAKAGATLTLLPNQRPSSPLQPDWVVSIPSINLAKQQGKPPFGTASRQFAADERCCRTFDKKTRYLPQSLEPIPRSS